MAILGVYIEVEGFWALLGVLAKMALFGIFDTFWHFWHPGHFDSPGDSLLAIGGQSGGHPFGNATGRGWGYRTSGPITRIVSRQCSEVGSRYTSVEAVAAKLCSDSRQSDPLPTILQQLPKKNKLNKLRHERIRSPTEVCTRLMDRWLDPLR